MTTDTTDSRETVRLCRKKLHELKRRRILNKDGTREKSRLSQQPSQPAAQPVKQELQQVQVSNTCSGK